VEHDLNLAHEEIVSTTSSSRLEQFRFRPKKALTKDAIADNLTKGRRFNLSIILFQKINVQKVSLY